VARDYYGRGPQGQLAADLIAEARDRKAAHVQALKGEQEQWRSLGLAMDRLDRACEVMERAALLAGAISTRGGEGMSQHRPGPGAADGPELDEVRTLLARAATGDRDALPALRALLEDRPGVWAKLGDLAAHVQMAWVDRIGGPDVAVKEALVRKAEDLRSELAAPGATPLERLLIDRVVATWLEVHAADLDAAVVGDVLPERVELAMKRQEAAGRRHTRAVESLVSLRRLLPAAVKPTPGTEDSRAEPGVAQGEPADVVPFAPTPRSRKASRRGDSAGRGSTRGDTRLAGEPGQA